MVDWNSGNFANPFEKMKFFARGKMFLAVYLRIQCFSACSLLKLSPFCIYFQKNPDQWRIIFFIAAGFYFIGNLLFVVFGKVEVQSWNDAQPEHSTKKRNSTFVESQH